MAAKAKASTEKKKRGAPSKFPEKQMKAVEKLYRLGATDADVAEAMCVTEQTVNNWKKKHPSFFESLKGWKAGADELVEKSLFQRAIGCKVRDDKVFNNNGVALVVEGEKEYPPDAVSAIFWLKNRQPERWRANPEDSGEVDNAPINRIQIEVVGANTND